MTDTTEIGTVVVEPSGGAYAIERNRDLDIVRAAGPLSHREPRDKDSLSALLDDAGIDADEDADWVALQMRANSWCPASSSTDVAVESNTSQVTVVRSLDGVHRAEIFQNALGQYTMHQTRLVSNGRRFVMRHEWYVFTHEEMIEIATHAVLCQVEADAKDPDRRQETVVPAAESRWRETAEGQQFRADALRDDMGDQSLSRACGHPTDTGPCRNPVKGGGHCAAGHGRS